MLLTERTEPCPDLNWQRLRNMAQPIVDHQIAKLLTNQSWKRTPIELDLGKLMVDNEVVPIDYNLESLEWMHDEMVDLELQWKNRGTKRPSTVVETVREKKTQTG